MCEAEQTAPGPLTSLAILNGLVVEVPGVEQFAARQDKTANNTTLKALAPLAISNLPLSGKHHVQGAEANAADWLAELTGEATVTGVVILRGTAANVSLPHVATRGAVVYLCTFILVFNRRSGEDRG